MVDTPRVPLHRAKNFVVGLGGFLTALVGLIIVVRDFVEVLPSASDLWQRGCITVGACRVPQPVSPPSVNASPVPASPPGYASVDAPRVFILGPVEGEGTATIAGVRQRVQAEGLQIATDRDTASLVVELAPTVLDPVQASGNPAALSTVATLTATLRWNVAGAPGATTLQRQARGFGGTQADAARNSISAAVERLSESIAQEAQRVRP